jgi:hypothetical protein
MYFLRVSYELVFFLILAEKFSDTQGRRKKLCPSNKFTPVIIKVISVSSGYLKL